ncbi:helix-turn-helix domain-containing protein [Flagellimonas sp. HMM57]|uniref:helix-turn-helix domain-containing protein n=1 Tax=unclassified Flagellimonas TaxID=2644544 RepID=UPI0013CFD614|nr:MULTISPECIES: helix-turn-helix domain-containing protein [unclassified Flagellimonas]UII77731.1 helix-turn-helix domain-containing protein [Flagellimonas sp. HMM57]
MVQKFHPELNKVYFINKYTLLHIISGSGTIQVDFKNYNDWQDKAIYLEKGQYIKFFSDDFVVRKIEFPNKTVFDKKEVRVLFKHLISLGYINFNECEECKRYLSNTAFSENTSEIIDISSKQWYWQNPFQASKQEYQIIFDVKEIIDNEYYGNFNNKDLSALMLENGYNAQALVKDKIGLSVKTLLSNKRLMESKKKIAFTDKSIQEVSYETGYKDPAYFNRVFKNTTGQTPSDFRNDFDYENRDTFTKNLIELLKDHHAEHRNLEFYADKMNLSIKALSKKTRAKMNASLGQLIRNELISTSKKLLLQEASIKDIAYKLGFEEANHFSHFFKNYTGSTPTDYKIKKYNS